MEYQYQTMVGKSFAVWGVNTALQIKIKNKGLVFFPIFCAAVVHFRILDTFFRLDDYIHLFQIANDNFLNFLFDRFGGHLYITRNFVFYCMYKLFGTHSIYYFLIILLTHLINVYLLFEMLSMMIDDTTVASIGATIWGMSPINYVTLSWCSAFGVVMLATFFLLIIIEILRIAQGVYKLTKYRFLRLNLFGFAIASSYGFGITLVCILPVLAWILIPNKELRYKTALSIVPAVILSIVLFFLINYLPFITTTRDNGFVFDTIRGYLLNPSFLYPAIKFFFGLILYSLYCMAAFPLSFIIPNTFPNPLTNVSFSNLFITEVIVCLIVVISNLYLWNKISLHKKRYYYFAIVALTGIYPLITIGRAQFFVLFNLFSPWVATTPRYHYSGFIIMISLVCLLLSEFRLHFAKVRKIIGLVSLGIITISIYPSFQKAPLLDINLSDKERVIFNSAISEIEKEVLKYPLRSKVYLPNRLEPSFFLFHPAEVDFPGRAAVYMLKFPDNELFGRRVYFVEENAEVIRKVRQRDDWRIAQLLIAPGEAENGLRIK